MEKKYRVMFQRVCAGDLITVGCEIYTSYIEALQRCQEMNEHMIKFHYDRIIKDQSQYFVKVV